MEKEQKSLGETAYSKGYVRFLQEEIVHLKQKIQSGTQPVFANVDELIDFLEKD